jgi:hypothetical protein
MLLVWVVTFSCWRVAEMLEPVLPGTMALKMALALAWLLLAEAVPEIAENTPDVVVEADIKLRATCAWL